MRMETEMKEMEYDRSAQHVRIVCPACKTGELSLESVTSEVHCVNCGASFPVRNRIIDLLPTAQQIPVAVSMEWNWMVRIYETRWWRAGPFNSITTGISFKKEYKTLVQAMNLEGNELVLDLACGPGMYARPLARELQHGTVVGLDLSLPMLSYTTVQAQNEGLYNLLLIHGSATDLPFPDNQFDAVNCCGALHLFPELSTVQGICRVLKPGGIFTVATTRQLIKGRLGRRLYDYLHTHGWPKYFLQEELESLLTQAGFVDVTFHHAKRYWHVVSAVKPQ